MSNSQSPNAVVLQAALQAAVAELPVPAYILDRSRRFQWLNRAAVELLGDRVGQSFCRIVAPEHATAARMQFARKLLGGAMKPHMLMLIDRDGQRAEVSVVSAPLSENGRSLGVFGLVLASGEPGAITERSVSGAVGPEPTPRQLEILRLLALGHDTEAIAEHLGVVHHTVRNHMRGLFRELGVHSRLQAVARAYQLGLLGIEDVRGNGADGH